LTLKAIDVNKISNFLAKYRKAVADQKALKVSTPPDLETELTAEIAAKVAEIQYYRDHRPPSREEYLAGINLLKAQLAAIVGQNLAIQQRNQAKWDVTQAAYNSAFDSLKSTIEDLETKEKAFLDNLNTDPV
jgi:hypothetical protein